MNTPVLAPDFNPEIQIVNDRIMTTSLAISNVFEKNHRDVLRSIKDLEIPENYRERNFAPTFRDVPGPNGSVRKEPIVLITRDGFTILAMGFTGKKAMEFKIKYIDAFNRMEKDLQIQKEKSWCGSKIEIKETVPLFGDRDLERDRLRLERMRLRTDRAMKLKKMVLEFREREIFGLAEARQAALDAVSLLIGEDPSGPVSGAGEPVLAEEDPAIFADVCRAIALEQEPTDRLFFMRSNWDSKLETWLFDRGILPTSRTLGVCRRISHEVYRLSGEIHDRILEEERRIPSFQETLEEAVKQFLEGREG